MSKTKQQLIERTLQEVGVLAAGQAPSAEDAKVTEDEINPVLQDLAQRDIYAWGDTDSIEDEAFVHLAVLVADSIAVSFGKPKSEPTRLMAERRLRELKINDLAGSRQEVEYF